MQLHAKLAGDNGPPLLILHGLFGSAMNWNWHAKKWAHRFSVHALDLRNHGASPHSDEMNYPVMAADVLEYMDKEGIRHCFLLGHSMGGKVAMQLALDQPERVQALVIADMAPVAYEGEHDGIFEGLLAIDPGAMASRREADEVLAAYVDDELVRQFLLSNLVRDDSTENGGFRWRINLPVLERNYKELREALTSDDVYNGPVLFLRGEHSGYVQQKHKKTILSMFPNASVKTLMQAGHWLHAEKPESFNRLVAEFFQHHNTEKNAP